MWLNYKILLFQQFVAMVVFYLSSNLSYRHGSHGIYVLSYLHGHLRWYWQIWDRTGKKRDVQIWLVCVRHGKFVISHSYSAWVSVASAPSQVTYNYQPGIEDQVVDFVYFMFYGSLGKSLQVDSHFEVLTNRLTLISSYLFPLSHLLLKTKTNVYLRRRFQQWKKKHTRELRRLKAYEVMYLFWVAVNIPAYFA